MKVTIIGVGMGNPDTITLRGLRAIEAAECLVGAQRLLDAFSEYGAKRVAAVKPEEIVVALVESGCQNAAVLMSGDIGFYSGAKRFRAALSQCAEMRFEVECVAGVSSVQYFCALVGESWEETRLLSLHGRGGCVAGPVREHEKTFFLTGGEHSVQEICRTLCEHGLGEAEAWAGEELSYPDERVTHGTALTLSQQEFSPLAVLLVKNARPMPAAVTHGLPDEAFLRGDAPMTKREIRTAAISALGLRRGWTVWDVGAGTGSVSVELARLLPGGAVYAVEREEEALCLLQENRRHFALENLFIVPGSAPEALEGLPVPDAVFIGGTSGSMEAVLELIMKKNPGARIVATAIMLETIGAVLSGFARLGLDGVEVVQLTAARARSIGGGHMMTGQNPVYILSGGGGGQ